MKERWPEMLEYQQKVQAMTDLERARSELLDIVACARDGLWTPDLIERLDEAVARQIDTLLAAARREGENDAWKQLSKIETAAFIRGREAGLNLAALKDKYGSFDAKVQAQIAAARREGAELADWQRKLEREAGAEEMRERAAQEGDEKSRHLHECLEGEYWIADEIADAIRALSLTPEKPA